MNNDLCQLCQEREHNTIVTFDINTCADLNTPEFVCDICHELRLIQKGWIQDKRTSNWVNPKFAEKNTGDACIMCRAAMHKQCEAEGCECQDC